MANPTIYSVTTFVAEIEQPGIQEFLQKFQGSKTARTLNAARRMRAKKNVVKVPRNLLRQLWRITGGWKETKMKAGWADMNTQPDTSSRSGTKYWRAVVVGDLIALFGHDGTSYTPCLLLYRGQKVARIQGEGYYENPWINEAIAKGTMIALGTDWQGQN